MSEIWKDVPNFLGAYQVSDQGRVRSLDRSFVKSNGIEHTMKGRILKQVVCEKYSPYITLKKDSHIRWFRVCDLMAEAFLSNYNSQLYVVHINGNLQDNRLDNLKLSRDKGQGYRNRKDEEIEESVFSDPDPITGKRWRFVRWTNQSYQISNFGDIRRVK